MGLERRGFVVCVACAVSGEERCGVHWGWLAGYRSGVAQEKGGGEGEASAWDSVEGGLVSDGGGTSRVWRALPF